MDTGERNIPGVPKHVDTLEIFLEKQRELEKHATDHARNMSKTLEDIENSEQEMKIVKKKIRENKGEIDKLTALNNEVLYPREMEIVSTLSSLQKDKETMEREADKKSIQLKSDIEELRGKLDCNGLLNSTECFEKFEQKLGPDTEPAAQHAANTELLKYLQESLKGKEKELECPVCLETAQVPIFMCQESHLVCHNCLPKLKTCPECREKMPNPPKRHRTDMLKSNWRRPKRLN